MPKDFSEKAAGLYPYILAAAPKDAVRLIQLEMESAFLQGEMQNITEMKERLPDLMRSALKQ